VLPSLPSVVSRLHLRQLRLLIALDDLGSLLKAAEQVGLTQPGASKALQEVEDTLGVTLFTRTNRGLRANDAGLCVIRYARLIQTNLGQMHEEMEALLRGHGGKLALGTIMGAVPFLTEVLARLIRKHPAISVELVEDNSAELLRLLDRGGLDMAICRTTITERPDLYDSVFLRDETLAVVANLNHPAAKKKRIELADLADARWVVYSANMPMRLLLEREFREAGLRFPFHLVETTSAFATLSLLQREPSFVALLSSDVANFCKSFGMTSILPLRLRSRSEPYELVTRRGAPISPIARRLMEEFGL
jgi:DNA-binding transcriptional LysR family regulator